MTAATARHFAAVDLGASGGRVVRGVVDGARVTMEAVRRFPNRAIRRDGHLRWDLTGLCREVERGLALVPEAESIGIDTWGVDHGLLDGDGRLLAEPVSYRDDRTAAVIDDVHRIVGPEELFAINGLQVIPITTIYQLAAAQRDPMWERVAHAVLLPDLLAYWLTGRLGTEITNASTTGLLDVTTRTWSTELHERLGLPLDLFPPLQRPGAVRGHVASGTPVVAVGSHDTASAVAGVPAEAEHFAYIACGTWALVGLERPAPVLTEDVRRSGFTNELGIDDRTRFLHNGTGLWLLQECMRSWRRPHLPTLLADAADVPAGGPVVDVDDPAFVAPGAMPDRVAGAVGRVGMSPAEITRCIIDSLALAFASRVRRGALLAGVDVDVIHLVGGGSRNELLCQRTADVAGLPVIAGPAEATALGNLLVQARAAGAVPDSLDATRAIIAGSTQQRTYEPR